MFVIDRARELVGFSLWPWDSLYTPLVGCYLDGRLVAHAECREVPQPVGLAGPRQRCWFRLRVAPAARAALVERDPAACVMRIEDGAALPLAGDAAAPPARRGACRVEEIVARGAARAVPLDGFPAFCAAPYAHRIDALFLDLLNRRADPAGLAHYAEALEHGRPILAIRRAILASDEFIARRITVSDRIGALITSPMWRLLAFAETPGTSRVPLRAVRLSRYAALDDAAFAAAIHRDVHGDAPTPQAQAALAAAAALDGRRDVAAMLARDAADGGDPVDLVDD